jgi:hypothetical protein
VGSFVGAADVARDAVLATSMSPELVDLIKYLYTQAQATGEPQSDVLQGVSIIVDKHGAISVDAPDPEEWKAMAGELATYLQPEKPQQNPDVNFPSKFDSRVTLISMFVAYLDFPLFVISGWHHKAGSASGWTLVFFGIFAICAIAMQGSLRGYCRALGVSYWGLGLDGASARWSFTKPKNLRAMARALGLNGSLVIGLLYLIYVIDALVMVGVVSGAIP